MTKKRPMKAFRWNIFSKCKLKLKKALKVLNSMVKEKRDQIKKVKLIKL